MISPKSDRNKNQIMMSPKSKTNFTHQSHTHINQHLKKNHHESNVNSQESWPKKAKNEIKKNIDF